MAAPALVVCGPQTSFPSTEYLSRIQQILLTDPRLNGFLDAINDLPKVWKDLVDHYPQLSKVPGIECVAAISQLIEQGEFPLLSKKQLSVLLTPLTVVFQIVEYIHFLGSNADGITHSLVLKSASSGGIQGFCTGILAASALAFSKNIEDINLWGPVALRLAVCIGAFVDLAGPFADPPNETICVRVRWRNEDAKYQIAEILEKRPSSYISVIPDATSVTITMPKPTASSLFQLLSAQDLLSRQIELEGLFHCSQHEATVRQIIALCTSNSGFRFPGAEKLLVPLRSNFDGELVKQGKLHEIVVRSMLTEVSNWHLTISKALSELPESGSSTVLTLGPMECISPFIMRGFSSEIVKLSGAKLPLDASLGCDPVSPASANADLKTPRIINPSDYNYPEHAVAIVGMACKFPGASSLDEFWQVLTSGTSMVQRVPAERFSTEKLRRSENSKAPFWGNFVSDVNAFDHRFFKKSSREAVSMDPQQRLLLEVAYEAMASSGYFGDSPNTSGDDTGCFLGVGATDYSDNVASHPANAFSAVGTLRAFLSGKISHYFGWTGPSITYDTACSSSAVALHAACRAIAGGECSRALAGGVNLITSPNLHQNLMAASFLSPTGATKSFDAKADGYCRGEGVGLVVLKRLSTAVAAGDVILGVIAGSAVNQNSNATSITVPHSPSQIDLYRKVSRLAGIDPLDVSYVEAHGTGTPVGDPIEYESIREVFGGPQRSDTLFLGSVKANIGHTEAASGAAALIKTVLMLQHAAIPVQPNFTTLNSKIRSIASDNIEIPPATQSWVSNFRAACINNYGAAGSNAAMIVCQSPSVLRILPNRALPRYPIFISAHSDSSLMAYCSLLKTTIARNTYLPAADLLSSIAFNLAEKQNRTLPRSLITTAATLKDLSDQLSMNAVSLNISQKEINHSAKPVVLAFSGQTSNTIGLSEDVYAGSTLFRSHLDRCDAILRSSNLPTLYPGIFSTKPIEDLVTLHCMLFSFQYACAMSWIDSGLHIDTLVGHSFGQLTALSISGILSVSDALRLVSGRARLMRDRWGPERGSMIHIEGGIDAVQGIISSVTAPGSHHRLSVACYNATSSHVLVGSQTSIDAVEQLLAESRQNFQTVRSKRLNTTHGFHSEFTEPFLLELSKLAEQLVYYSATIPLETCSDWQSWTEVTSSHITEHTRQPVYFEQAVRRILKRFGPCTWLGVGPGTSITSMISRALPNSTSSLHIIQPVQLENPNALDLLAESTANLWRYGRRVQFWPFHRSQSLAYSPINLPPYQFEKSRHWLKYIDAIEEPPAPISVAVELKPVLLTPLQHHSGSQYDAEYSINQQADEFRLLALGHAVLGQPLCPVALYVELASRAALMINSIQTDVHVVRVEELEIKAPLGLDKDQVITLCLSQVQGVISTWTFELKGHGAAEKTEHQTQYAIGRVVLCAREHPSSITEFARFERLVDHRRYAALALDPSAEAMQGSVIYTVFRRVVDYADYYRGVKRIASKDNQVAGVVALSSQNEKWLQFTITHPLAVDNFLQVAGLHINSLSPCVANEIFVATKIDRMQPCREFSLRSGSQSWSVFSSFSRESEKEVVNDIFVFDPDSKKLLMIILGAHFTKVLATSLTKALSNVNPSQSVRATALPVDQVAQSTTITSNKKTEQMKDKEIVPTQKSSGTLEKAVLQLLHDLADVPMDESSHEISLEELGVDSLMVSEVLSAIRQTFGVDIPLEDYQSLSTRRSLSDYIKIKQNLGSDIVYSESSSSQVTLESSSASSVSEDALDSPDSPQYISRLAQLVAGHLETSVATLAPQTCLGDVGLDSLLAIELSSDIERMFQAQIDVKKLTGQITFGALCDLVLSQQTPQTDIAPLDDEHILSPFKITVLEISATPSRDSPALPRSFGGSDGGMRTSDSLNNPYQIFVEQIKHGYDEMSEVTGFANFWNNVYPTQTRLVVAYIVKAFDYLGCPLPSLKPGEQVHVARVLPRHKSVMAQLMEVLASAGLIMPQGGGFVRTHTVIDETPAAVILEKMLQEFPQHSFEHKLLDITGPKLGACLSGDVDPLQLLFRSKETKALLEDVYTNAPMFAAGTRQLGNFLSKAFASRGPGNIIRILELGGGTGGTTKYIIDHLLRMGINFRYTFTDISSSLVASAKKKFAAYNFMDYMVLDIEKPPPAHLASQYNAILATNCVHATKSLTNSLTNLRKMLQKDGFVSLVELTRNIPWFDLVFGLLDGWWLFEDGRNHALADTPFWEKSMKAAGFETVAWTEGTAEAATLRIIAGFQSGPDMPVAKSPSSSKQTSMETVVFKDTGSNLLFADIYYPSESEVNNIKRPIALMIHGGGHVMLSRKDIRRRQTQLLLANGFLPVSIDYRLCPELNIFDGPMTDIRDALRWAREELPKLELKCPGLQVDGEKVVAVGWSTGGHLAMTLAWTPLQHDLKPPEAILAFYCPTDYEASCWKQPNYPESRTFPESIALSERDYDLLEGVQDVPITAYNVPTNQIAVGTWMSLADSRSRIALHMNWKAQTLPILLGGLPSKSQLPHDTKGTKRYHLLPQPSREEIILISPYAQILRGSYRTPTFLIHGTEDDLIPWQQTQKVYDALVSKGIRAGSAVVEGAEHLFDLYPDPDGKGWKAVQEGYRFLSSCL